MTPEKTETLKKLRASVGQLSTTTMRQLEKSLPWYSRLSSDERSALGLVAQNGIAAFVAWYERPSSPSWILSDVFGTAPTELTRSISLQKALQLIRIVVEVVEDQVPVIAPEADQPSLREAVLRYSREVAFAAADVYARAAESRGSWDTRLEALIVDAILRGENTDALRSRIAALGWKAQERFTVMVGNSPSEPSASYVSELRRMAGRYAEDALVGIQGDRLILILGGVHDRETAYVKLSEMFAPGPVVYGAEASSLLEASGSAQSAFAGLTAARAWPAARWSRTSTARCWPPPTGWWRPWARTSSWAIPSRRRRANSSSTPTRSATGSSACATSQDGIRCCRERHSCSRQPLWWGGFPLRRSPPSSVLPRGTRIEPL